MLASEKIIDYVPKIISSNTKFITTSPHSDNAQNHQCLFVALKWTTHIGTLDIAIAFMTLSSFRVKPRTCYMKCITKT